MKKGPLPPNLKLSLPPPDHLCPSEFLTESGKFEGGDSLFNRNGLRLVSQSQAGAPAIVESSESDKLPSLDDFEAIKVIGKGNGGVVHLVRHKWTGQFFALKTIQMNKDESVRRHVAREIKINQSSQCPYIVVCHQSFYDNGMISLILEYMNSGSLADFLKKVHIIPEPYLAAICKQVLKGLWYLHHEKHIIHRDLKPSNLLINDRGEVKITDFGVSTILASTSSQADTFVGTYTYMAPERISGIRYGYRSDIWSLGLVLLECAMGQFPYSPPHPEGWKAFYEIMNTIIDQPAPFAPPGLFSPEFCSFISACVQKDPKDRLSANELMAHPFIAKYHKFDTDLALYFTIGGPH